jgi:hypothetical protein
VTEFVSIENTVDAGVLEQETYELLEARFEGWKPAEGDLLVWLVKACSRIGSTLVEQASEISKAALQVFGEKVVNVPPAQTAAAVAESIWELVDDKGGYEIEAGSTVTIEAPGARAAGFRVVETVLVPSGVTKARVLLQSVESGVKNNGLSGPVSLQTSYAFVVEPGGIEIEGVTAGGVDEEDEDAYLNRLTEELQLLSLSLIVPGDFEIDARSHGGIARALCIPAYDADAEEENVPLCATTVPIDEAGQEPPTPVREALQESQAAKVPSGVNVFVGVPTYTKVDQAVEVSVLPGFDPTAVVAAIKARLAAYLSPANCGLPTSSGDTGNPAGWNITTAIYRNEEIVEVDRVAGVDRVVTLLLGGGAGKDFTVASATDKFTSAAHGFLDGDAIVLRTGLVPGAPLAAGTVYYVRDKEVNAFKLAATAGGAAIDISSDGSGTAVKLAAVESVALAGVAPLSEAGEIVVSAV